MTIALAATSAAPVSERRVIEQRLRQVISANYPLLRRAIRRLGVREFEVDDVLQEVLIAFCRKADTIHPYAERQFLLQAAFRTVLFRQRGFVRRREELGVTFEELRELRPNPEEELCHQESLRVLDGILAAMPLELRMVFNLCEVERLTVPEAAAILEIPVGTAATRLRRAREIFSKLAAKARGAVAGATR